MRLVLPLLAVTLLLAGCGEDEPDPVATPAPTFSPAASPGPTVQPVDPLSPKPAIESAAPLGRRACRAADLRVADADLLASSTTLEEVFVVRTSGPPCQLRGWPAVRLLDGSGDAITITARRTGTAVTATLSRATSLSFVLGTPRSSSCQDVTTLVARLPGTDRDLRAATTMQVCLGQLRVGPVQRRQDDEGAEH